MCLSTLAAVLAVIILLVVAAFVIPLLVQMRKTAEAVEAFVQATQADLVPTLQELRENLTNLRAVTAETASRTEDLHVLLEELGNAGRNIRTVNSVVGNVLGLLAGPSLWLTGAKVAGQYVVERMTKKRGN